MAESFSRRSELRRGIRTTLNDERRAAHRPVILDGADREETGFVRRKIFQGLFYLLGELLLPVSFGYLRLRLLDASVIDCERKLLCGM